MSYDADPEEVRKILLRIADSQIELLTQPKPLVQFDGFGDSSLDFILHFYINDFLEIERIKSDLRFKIFAALKKAEIEIPFPQRDLWVRSTKELTEVASSKESSSEN